MGARELITTTLAICIGSLLACLVSLRMFIAFIKSPIKFFWENNPESPTCLLDPALGQHRYVRLENVRLHYVESGDESKPLMLMLHGFPEFWYSWRYQIKEFQKDYRVVALDQRGYSHSDAPSGITNYDVAHLAEDVKQLLPKLGYKSCVLVGHDWGGAVAWTVAGLYPELVDKLIIMNCPHPRTFTKYVASHLAQFKKSWYMFFFYVPLLPELYMCLKNRRMLTAVFTSKTMGLKCNRLTPDDIQAYKSAFPTLGSFTGPLNYIRAITRTRPPRQKKITAPSLLIWGCKDGALEKGLAPMAASHVQSLRIKYIEESSHWVQMDCPVKVNECMREFLA